MLYSAKEASDLLTRYEAEPHAELLKRACAVREESYGSRVSYSPKVFIPLTQLCRNVCAYCTFARAPRSLDNVFLSPEQVLEIARAGERAGCREALFTIGDKPELRYAAAREALERLGFESTFSYLRAICELVVRETTLLPHVNAGVMSESEIVALREVSVSQGIMLESISERLCVKGGPHYGSPDKNPSTRISMIEAAGRAKVPFTSGILIGIGESRLERVQSLLALRGLHSRYGHIQEIIIQNFRAKAGTRMADAPEPDLLDLQWTAAVARLIFDPTVSIQAPPNLSYGQFARLLDAGINDWGGVSPVTPDHVNPEAPWPDVQKLKAATTASGLSLVARLPVYPSYIRHAGIWLGNEFVRRVLEWSDSDGFVREDDWATGLTSNPPSEGLTREQVSSSTTVRANGKIDAILNRALRGSALSEDEIARLFEARGTDVEEICSTADSLRRATNGDVVGYVVNRNINYSNVCYFRCGFCAFSKGKKNEELRGPAYDLSLEEVARRAREAWDRGASEVCMQGGINPHYSGETYMSLLRAVKEEVPGIHVHAFSPLEISQGAQKQGWPVHRFLERLLRAGLGSLPGTAAEILDDEVRKIICPDKINTGEWLSVVRAAHEVGLRTTATIMFGHVEQPVSWARHLIRLRDLQQETGGFTEFVPLPFVHMESPLYLRGRTRRGPTWREVRLMHAVARLALHPGFQNIQVSWVKLGVDGAAAILNGGANDLGGTLMNESISRAAGTQHGQELAPERMEALIRQGRRIPHQRTTLYREADVEQRARSFDAPPLKQLAQTPYLRASRSRV